MSKLYSPEEIADFLFGHSDLSHESEIEIVQALADWDEHMEAGGHSVGTELGGRRIVCVGFRITASGAMDYAGVRASVKQVFDEVFKVSDDNRTAWLAGDQIMRGLYYVEMIDAKTGDEFGPEGWGPQ